MCGILENLQNDLVVIYSLRRCRQAKGKCRLEIREDFLICIGSSVMRFIHNQVIKIIVFELIQM